MAGVAEKELQESPLSRSEVEHRVAPAGRARAEVEDQVLVSQFPRIGAGRHRVPPRKGPDAGEQFLEGEGFGQVVVRSAVETRDPVFELAPGGK